MGLTTDRDDPCLKIIERDGMQACYLVLSPEELAKEWQRPLRQDYRHIVCGAVTRMGVALSQTYARDPKFYGGTYCVGCKTHFDLRKFVDNDSPLQYQFEWLGRDGKPDGSYVGE